MKTITQSRTFRIQTVGAAAGSVLAIAASQIGLTAGLVGLALALVIFYFTFSFSAGPLDARGTRVRVVFLCLALVAWLVAGFAVIFSAIQGHSI